MKVLPYCSIFLIPILAIAGNLLGGIFNYLTPITLFGFVTILDFLVGLNKRNPTDQTEERIKSSFRFKLVTLLCVPIQFGVITWALFVFKNGIMNNSETVGFIISVGISSGILGINIAHELAHRLDNKFEPLLAQLLLWTVGYMHWSIEHVFGHHYTVGTPKDPATAKLGEPVSYFLPKTIIGGFLSSWRIESCRLNKVGKSSWSYQNRILLFLVSEIILVVVIVNVFNINTALFFIAQGAVAVVLLELVNYVEHYGIVRKKITDDEYEPVKAVHSWNSSHMITNYLLVNLQRHADHHYYPERRYQILRHFDKGPQLPTGYPGMILLALIPFMWRFVMNKRVKENQLFSIQ